MAKNVISVGDVVEINNRESNCVLEKGIYLRRVISIDYSSIGVDNTCGNWHFYKDTGEAYAGDAVIIGVFTRKR